MHFMSTLFNYYVASLLIPRIAHLGKSLGTTLASHCLHCFVFFSLTFLYTVSSRGSNVLPYSKIFHLLGGYRLLLAEAVLFHAFPVVSDC